MPDEQLKMLIKVLGEQLAETPERADEVVHILTSETVKFRDKLLEDAGITFTIADTQAALDALGLALDGEELPAELSSEQQALAQIFLDRLTPFRQV